MQPDRVPSLSAFFPVHNEEGNLVGAATGILEVLPTVAHRWELIVVDDGSSDRTALLAETLARSRPGVRVIRHPVNRGYGAAIRSGLRAARHELIFLTDGDQQFDPTQIRRLLAELPCADVVVGYRPERADPTLRRFNTWAWNRLVRTVFRLPVRDVNCAFKLLRRHVIEGVTLRADGAMISTEILVRALQQGFRIVEVPVGHFPRREGAASGARFDVIVRAFAELVLMFVELRRPAPQRARAPVGSASAP